MSGERGKKDPRGPKGRLRVGKQARVPGIGPPPPLCLGSLAHVNRAWSQFSDLPVGGRSHKSPPNLDPAPQSQRGLDVGGGGNVQAPGKQIQTRGGVDAENKLGLAGGCDPASLRTGGEKNQVWATLGLGVAPGPMGDPDESGVESRPVGVRGWEGPARKPAV